MSTYLPGSPGSYFPEGYFPDASLPPPPPIPPASLMGTVGIRPRLAGSIDPAPQVRGLVRIQSRVNGKPEVE